MDFIAYLLFLLIGLSVGGGSIFLLLRGRIQSAGERAAADAGRENTALEERLAGRERELLGLQENLAEAREEARAARDGEKTESMRRAAAEQKNTRVPELEAVLGQKDAQIGELQKAISDLRASLAESNTALEKEHKAAEEKLAVLNDAEKKLTDAFKALSSTALANNNESFLTLAKSTLEKFQESAKGDLEKRREAIESMVKPVGVSLEKFNTKIESLEKDRIRDHASMLDQVRTLQESERRLHSQTANLVTALRRPEARGRWGEIQLRRVLEMAGMLSRCDFEEQKSVETEEGRLRPDVIIKLPGNKSIVVDAKTPLGGYLEAIEAKDDETRQDRLKAHARQVRDRITELGLKSYWRQFDTSPDFVVLFLPGEVFFAAALQQDPELIEYGVEKRVLVVSPTGLIALLRAAHYGWQQESLAEDAKMIRDLGKDLYKRISAWIGHLSDVRRSLEKAVVSYDKSIRSLETRVLPQARRFQELESTSDMGEIAPLEPIGQTPRALQAPEDQALPNAD